MKEIENEKSSVEFDLPRLEDLINEEPSVIIPRLYSMVVFLLNQNSELQEQLRILREENATLKEEIKELKSRLNMDSHNSSKPPSSDGLRKKPKSLRRPSGRLPGGQKGHEGHALNMVENPDNVVPHRVDSCKGCKRSLKDVEAKEYIKAQIFDLPPIQLIVEEHRAEVKDCPNCGLENKADLPQGVVPGAQYGDRAKSFMTYLNQYQQIPAERTCECFSDIFSRSVSAGTLYNVTKVCYESLEGFEGEVKRQIIDSPVVRFDETGVSLDGKNNWLHVASTPLLTFYAIHPKRGEEATDSIGILPVFNGTAVHDFWKTYLKYPCKHSLCNGHNLRDLTFAYEEKNAMWANGMKDLLLDIKKTVDNAKNNSSSCLEKEVIKEFEDAYDKIVHEGLGSYPPIELNNNERKRGRKKQSKDKNLLDRLRDHKEKVLAFMHDFEVPFDNNLAERDLRMMKLKMKISGTFRSDEGAKIFCRIRSYISTAKKQGKNVLDVIQSLFTGKPFLPVFEDTG